jgi:hypothetical protein
MARPRRLNSKRSIDKSIETMHVAQEAVSSWCRWPEWCGVPPIVGIMHNSTRDRNPTTTTLSMDSMILWDQKLSITKCRWVMQSSELLWKEHTFVAKRG